MELFYRRFGGGPPLIILHGLYGSSDNWVSIGKALASNFEVFIIDQRNHGDSPHSKEHNYTLLKNDLYDFMNQHGIEKAVLMGHSMGGKTVMFFSADYPERVQSLLVIDISPRSYKSLLNSVPQAIDHMDIINAMLEVDFSVVEKRSDVDKQLSQGILYSKIRHFLLKNVGRDKEGNYFWKLNIETLRDQLPEIMDGMDVKRFSNGNGITGFPVLFIKGENSGYISTEDITLIQTIFPAADIASIPGAGHWLHAEKPELLLKTIKYFVLG